MPLSADCEMGLQNVSKEVPYAPCDTHGLLMRDLPYCFYCRDLALAPLRCSSGSLLRLAWMTLQRLHDNPKWLLPPTAQFIGLKGLAAICDCWPLQTQLRKVRLG